MKHPFSINVEGNEVKAVELQVEHSFHMTGEEGTPQMEEVIENNLTACTVNNATVIKQKKNIVYVALETKFGKLYGSV